MPMGLSGAIPKKRTIPKDLVNADDGWGQGGEEAGRRSTKIWFRYERFRKRRETVERRTVNSYDNNCLSIEKTYVAQLDISEPSAKWARGLLSMIWEWRYPEYRIQILEVGPGI